MTLYRTIYVRMQGTLQVVTRVAQQRATSLQQDQFRPKKEYLFCVAGREPLTQTIGWYKRTWSPQTEGGYPLVDFLGPIMGRPIGLENS